LKSYSKALIHRAEITSSDIKELRIKDSNCTNTKIIKSDLSHATIKGSNLTNVSIESCKLDGMKINGHLVSELIREREEVIKTKGDKLL